MATQLKHVAIANELEVTWLIGYIGPVGNHYYGEPIKVKLLYFCFLIQKV